MKPQLVILAAGLASRYGGLKQLESVGPAGEAIIDYSVYDAIQAGYDKVVFVIRKEIEDEFRHNFIKRFEDRIDADCVIQDPESLPDGFTLPPDREKPWGTAHALLAAEKAIQAPFVVINADDFYGREAFRLMHDFLSGSGSAGTEYAMAGYRLGNTLSKHGTVSRGVCDVDEQGYLQSVTELTSIARQSGVIVSQQNGEERKLPDDAVVSMNFWGFTPAVFDQMHDAFRSFLQNNIDKPRAECYIPTVVDHLINQGQAQVKVLKCEASWFGITYKDDLETARSTILQKIEQGDYPHQLWG